MRAPGWALVASQALNAFSKQSGERIAYGYLGRLSTLPIAWACRAHDGFFDSPVTMYWPPAACALAIRTESRLVCTLEA